MESDRGFTAFLFAHNRRNVKLIKLNEYGWNQSLEANWEKMNETLTMKKCVPGRVALEHKRMYRVITAEGEWLSVCSGDNGA